MCMYAKLVLLESSIMMPYNLIPVSLFVYRTTECFIVVGVRISCAACRAVKQGFKS